MLRRNVDVVVMEDRKIMSVMVEMNLGEMVNRIRVVRVEMSRGVMVVLRVFLGMVSCLVVFNIKMVMLIRDRLMVVYICLVLLCLRFRICYYDFRKSW